MAPPAHPALTLEDVALSPANAPGDRLQLAFAPGTVTFLRGTADSGHARLLRILGLLDTPARGAVWLAGKATTHLNEEERIKLRDRQVGFVFASPFLLPAFTPIENVAMPLFKLSDTDTAEAQRRSEQLLHFAGLPDLVQDPCGDLTALDQHRVALARALVNQPAVLLLEELDSALTGPDLHAFLALLRRAATRFEVAAVATVTPEFDAVAHDRVLDFADGAPRVDSELFPRPEA